MAQFPCLPLWTDAWVADTAHLSIAEEGAYFRLMHTMWRTPGCRVPNDNGWLMRHLRLTKDEVRDILQPVIAEFCQVEDNFIVQKRLKKEFVHSFEKRGMQRELAKRRWRKQKAQSDGNTNPALPPKP